jgi:hypothetical protein
MPLEIKGTVLGREIIKSYALRTRSPCSAHPSPSSRPNPLRLFPPHGAWQKQGCEQFTQIHPALISCSWNWRHTIVKKKTEKQSQ